MTKSSLRPLHKEIFERKSIKRYDHRMPPHSVWHNVGEQSEAQNKSNPIMKNTVKSALQLIEECKHSQAPSLDLTDFQFTDDDFPIKPLMELAHSPALSLNLGSTDLISTIEKLDNRLGSLVTSLTLDGRKNDLRSLIHLQNLTSLTLCDPDVESLPLLSRLEKLQFLSIGASDIYNGWGFGFDLNWIADLTHLESLFLDVPLFNVESAPIARLQGLRSLNINPYEDHLHLIGQLLNLELLVFNSYLWESSDFDESDIRPLSNLVNLKKLDIGSFIVHDFGFLKRLKILEYLYLGMENLIENLDSLGQLYPLKSLGIEESFRDTLNHSNFKSLEFYFSNLKPLDISGRKVKLKVSEH